MARLILAKPFLCAHIYLQQAGGRYGEVVQRPRSSFMVHRAGGTRRRRCGQWKMVDSERTQGVINSHCLHTTPCQCLFEAPSGAKAVALRQQSCLPSVLTSSPGHRSDLWEVELNEPGKRVFCLSHRSHRAGPSVGGSGINCIDVSSKFSTITVHSQEL